jgi:1,4-dihydroxy-2-naphthoate octaprenyltransferase
VLASRPATLSAALVPVAVGTACAASAGGTAWLAAAAALFGACMIQIGTNFANDVFDFEKGTDDETRLGPVRAAQAGLLSASQLKRGMVVSFGLATLAGVYLVSVGGWPVVAIGVASVLSGIAYTGGPYPLGYHGLGDVFVMLFFGFVAVCGTEYVQLVQGVAARELPTHLALYASVPVGALATAILVVNNLRDRVGDARTGKRTLAVRLGATGARVEYLLLMGLTYGVPVYLFHAGLVGSLIFVVFVTFPAAAVLSRAVWVRDGADLNSALTGTAKLLLAFGLLFALGIEVTT